MVIDASIMTSAHGGVRMGESRAGHEQAPEARSPEPGRARRPEAERAVRTRAPTHSSQAPRATVVCGAVALGRRVWRHDRDDVRVGFRLSVSRHGSMFFNQFWHLRCEFVNQ